MTLIRFLFVGGLSIAVLTTPASAQQDGVSLDGNWAGKTSQGSPIGFRIEAGVMRTLELDWAMHFDAVCPGRTGSSPAPGRIERGELFYFHPKVQGYEPPQVLFPAFTLSRDVETPQVPVTMVVKGSFGSDSTVSGEITLTATGCPGRETLTWQGGRRTNGGR